jgi:hypothetical protein
LIEALIDVSTGFQPRLHMRGAYAISKSLSVADLTAQIATYTKLDRAAKKSNLDTPPPPQQEPSWLQNDFKLFATSLHDFMLPIEIGLFEFAVILVLMISGEGPIAVLSEGDSCREFDGGW